MSSSYVLLIFDLDGTLFDSETQIHEAVQIVRSKYNLPPRSLLETSLVIGLPAQIHFDDVGPQFRLQEKLVLEFRKELKNLITFRNKTFPGVTEFINLAHANGYKLAIATTKPTQLAEWTIEHSELDGAFHHIQGTDNFPPKPSPEVINRCLKILACDHNFMFGDRAEDMQAAKESGVYGIGVAHSSARLHELTGSAATKIILDFSEIENLSTFLFDIVNDNRNV